MAIVPEISEIDQTELLRIARATLKEFFATGRLAPGKPHKKTLLQKAAVFVSLHTESNLRGCIGTTDSRAPLYLAVQEMTVAAASRDPRFAPVRAEEIPLLRIEVSVLGAREEVSDPKNDIKVGVHGVAVATGGRRGVLLPQVAIDHGWDTETFLDMTCEKAGLERGAWKQDDVIVERFVATIFKDPAPVSTAR